MVHIEYSLISDGLVSACAGMNLDVREVMKGLIFMSRTAFLPNDYGLLDVLAGVEACVCSEKTGLSMLICR